MDDSLDAQIGYESLVENLLSKSDPLENFLNQMRNELGRLSALQTYLILCFPGLTITEFNSSFIILTDSELVSVKVHLNNGYVIKSIEYYPLQMDDSDNYERHTDGK